MNDFYGYIEGYYGRMLSWDERAMVLDTLGRLSLNTYIYGPKEDLFHRREWKRAYPGEWNVQFTRFVKHGRKKNVRVVPSLSPGLSYDYCSASDYKALVRKFKTFVACGAETVALFMDDIPDTLPAGCKNSFSSLGHAHAVLLGRLQKDLQNHDRTVSLLFCPTVYCDRFAQGGVLKNRYLLDLSAGMPRNVGVFWTGPSVISDKIDKKDIAPVSKLFCGNVIVWDNLYANDYCPHRLFIGPYRGRSGALRAGVKGICLNPTGHLYTDSMLLWRLSTLVSTKKPPFLEPRAAREFSAVARFFDSPFARLGRPDLSPRRLSAYQRALSFLIWQWKSPLQREWYPYLFMLDSDLKLFDRVGKKTATQEWVFKKYPPVLAAVLNRTLALHKRKNP
jgi:hypothetical protein